MSFASRGAPGRWQTELAPILAPLSLLVVTACATASETVADAPRPEPPAADVTLDPVDVSARAQPLEVGADVPPDPEVLAFLAPQAKTVNARAQRVVGSLKGPLERGKPESTLGNFVTDAMREGTGRVTGTAPDLCFTNSGGLRRNLDAGPVTEGVLVELMPFDNSIIVFDASAEQLEGILARLAQRGDPSSGVTYTRRSGKAHDVRVGGEPIARGRSYRLCTNDYIFEGGGGYPFEGVSNVSYTGVLLRDLLIQQFEQAQKAGEAIAPALDGRVKETR